MASFDELICIEWWTFSHLFIWPIIVPLNLLSNCARKQNIQTQKRDHIFRIERRWLAVEFSFSLNNLIDQEFWSIRIQKSIGLCVWICLCCIIRSCWERAPVNEQFARRDKPIRNWVVRLKMCLVIDCKTLSNEDWDTIPLLAHRIRPNGKDYY